jgi:Tol biopolymer transport system component
MIRYLRQPVSTLLILILLSIASYPVANAQSTQNLQDMRIVFTSDRDGTDQLYLMNVDGTNVSMFPYAAARPRFNYQIRYSPVINRIIFEATQDLGYPTQITMTNLDGTGITSLIENRTLVALGGFSPDGAKIVYTATSDGVPEIYTANSNGTNVQQLTSNSFIDNSPEWSPNGLRIIYTSTKDGNSEIYLMNTDGTNQLRLTNNIYSDTSPRWSPDGTRIVFVSDRNGGKDQIFAMNSDGSNVIQLTNSLGFNIEPSWSPDSSRIVFTSGRDDNTEIYVMNSDGTQQTRLTNNLFRDGSPNWVPSQQTQTGRGLRGTYYALNNLTGLRFFRLSNQINFN